MSLRVRMFLPLIAIGCWYIAEPLHAVAAPVAVGVIQSSGEFRVDGFLIPGNATVFDGSTVETLRASSETRLTDGFTMTLTPESRATIFRDRTVLDQGVLLIRNAGRQVIHAGVLRVSSLDTTGRFEVSVSPPGHVVVAVSTGTATVRTAAGSLVARVLQGTAMDFLPQTAAPNGSVKLTGCLTGKAGVFFVTDVTSKVTVEVLGPNLGRYLDTRVEVAATIVPGFTPAGGADHAVTASEIKSLGPCLDRPATPPAGRGGSGNPGSASGGASGGLSSASLVAIVGGVAVAGTLGGLAASGSFDASSPASPK